MNQPRYRVRTLLIVTTIAAVVVACLAPWLRWVWQSMWSVTSIDPWIAGFAKVSGVLVVAALHTMDVARRQRKIEQKVVDECLAVRMQFAAPGWNAWRALGLMAVLLWMFCGEIARGYRPRMFPLETIDYVTDGVGIVLVGVILSHLFFLPDLQKRFPIRWINTAMYFPGYTAIYWKDLRRYEWVNRSAGRLNIIVPTNYTWFPIKLAVRPEDVDAVDDFLRNKLPANHS